MNDASICARSPPAAPGTNRCAPNSSPAPISAASSEQRRQAPAGCAASRSIIGACTSWIVVDLVLRGHRDILRADPVGRVGRNARHRALARCSTRGAHRRRQARAVRRWRARRAARRRSAHRRCRADTRRTDCRRRAPPPGAAPSSPREIGLVLGRDQRVAEGGGDQRLVVGRARSPRAAARAPPWACPPSSRIWPFELEEIGIVRLGLDQRLRSRHRPCRDSRAL